MNSPRNSECKSEFISGVALTPLKIISTPSGDVRHAIKSSSPGYEGFGEAYFSEVTAFKIKGWKKHLKMTLNLVVVSGEIQFVVLDNRENSATQGKYFEAKLSAANYQRLTVAPGLWMAFRGCHAGLNLLLNIANIEHDPKEAVNVDISEFPYEWE